MSKQSWEGDYDRGYDRGYADGARNAVANARRDALKWAAERIRNKADEIYGPMLIDEICGLLHGLADAIEKGEPPQ